MGSDSEKDCCDAMRHRVIPKLTQSEKNDTTGEKKQSGGQKRNNKAVLNGKIETSEERVERINHTSVSFMQFWFQCLDWEMLRLFFGLLMLFFTLVGIISFIYLCFVFAFNEKLWYFYFPVSKREELWLVGTSNCRMQTLETTTNSAVFSRKSKIIWKPNLDLNIGMSGLSNITLDQTNQRTYEFAHITMEDYILQGVILIIVLLLLLFLYICFWKWVAQVILIKTNNTN